MSATPASAICFSPKELEKMARREYQNPPLKRTAGANPRWYIRVRKKVLIEGKGIGKKQVRVYLGECPTMGIRDANRRKAEVLQEINGQVYTIQSNIPLNEFFLIYNAKHIPTLRASTQAKYRSHCVNHILPAFGKWKLAAIGTEEIQGFLLQKEAEGIGWWARNDLRNIISSIFTKAEDWGYWKERNPALRATPGPKKPKREKRLLTDEQVELLLSELPADIALMVRLADSTGMRISEILGLKWRFVNLLKGEIYIRESFHRGDTGAPKTERSARTIPLADLIADVAVHKTRLRDSGPDDYVFQHPNGGPYDDRGLNQHFLRKIAKRHGFYFEGFGFHTFRRGSVTGFQEDGGSTAEASQIVGHSRPAITNDYTIMQVDRQRELIQKRQNRLAIVK